MIRNGFKLSDLPPTPPTGRLVVSPKRQSLAKAVWSEVVLPLLVAAVLVAAVVWGLVQLAAR